MTFNKAFFPAVLVLVYMAGFIYDASFLEEFGLKYFQSFGSPQDYLIFGGMVFAQIFSEMSIGFSLLILSVVIYLFISDHVTRWLVSSTDSGNTPRNTHNTTLEMLMPLLKVGLVAALFTFLIPATFNAHKQGVADAKEIKELRTSTTEGNKYTEDTLCLSERKGCFIGVLLRNRDGMAIFWDFDHQTLSTFTEGDYTVMSTPPTQKSK